MANLRAKYLAIRGSTSIEVQFTDALDLSLGVGNVRIDPLGANAEGLAVRAVSVEDNVLSLTVEPMVPGAQYDLVLFSTSFQPFIGKRGERLLEDGATNHLFFVGAPAENEVLDRILAGFPEVYGTEDSRIRDVVEPGTLRILGAQHDANEVRAAAYISVTVEDEPVTRGSGPFDRFANEGVYRLLRAGPEPASAGSRRTISYESFPSDPISLKQVDIPSEIVSNSSNDSNNFSGLVVTLSKGRVIRLVSLTLVRSSQRFEYDIEQYRYGLLESRFDSDNAYPALDLSVSQVRLSQAAVGPSFPMPQGSDIMEVSYVYEKSGRFVEGDTVEVTSAVPASRESVPALATSFFLDHAPIINPSTKETASLGGVNWLDPSQNYDPEVNHPAFTSEIPFSESSLPSTPGEFAVDYATGRVLAFGVDGSGTDGTTARPPVATYTFRRTFQDRLDYNFIPELSELAAVNTEDRDLVGSAATVSFSYEDGFADGSDFEFASHIEALDERVENRLIGNFGLKTLHGPIKEVFRIFNETTGVVYRTTRVSGNQVYFSGTSAPDLRTVRRERAQFAETVEGQIVVTDALEPAGKAFDVFRVELSATDIAARTGDYIGASFNTSLEFSDGGVFAREMYFDPNDSLEGNLQRLSTSGDYMVDYVFGLVYAAVAPGSETAVGTASYRYGRIQTRNQHITAVNNVYRSATPGASNTKTFSISNVGDQLVALSDLEPAGESQIDGSPITVQVLGSQRTIEVSADILRLRHIFQVTDLRTSHNPVDFAPGATVVSATPNTILLDPLGAPVEEDSLTIKEAGSRKYVKVERITNVRSGAVQLAALATDPSDPTFLRRVYAVIDASTGVDYFAQGSDGYVDVSANRIYLPTGVLGSAIGKNVDVRYRAVLLGGAAVTVDYTPGDIFIDYEYCRDEILISYEYGDNVLDWSVSDTLSEGDTYFVSYQYGAMRSSLRDNFGALTNVEELATAPLSLDRELYRAGLTGTLQSFLTGPTIPAVKRIVSAFTEVDPDIVESIFLEWILGRDHLHLQPMALAGSPSFAKGRFGNGILLESSGQTARLPATSNLRMAEGTWEAFIVPSWDGIDNDASLTLDLLMDGVRDTGRVFLGSAGQHPEEIPFTISREDDAVLGKPTALHSETGFFLWYDSTHKQWRLRMRAPTLEERHFTGTLGTTGQFNNVRLAVDADGYGPDEPIEEINDSLRSTDSSIAFSFVADGYDIMNMPLDSYGGSQYAAFDGIDFQSDDIHYLFDAGAEKSRNRMSLFKDGRGFLRYRIWDANRRLKELSANIGDWTAGSAHHVAASWRVGTAVQRDEMHLFIDGREQPNTYRFKGYLPVPGGTTFMDPAGETLVNSVSAPTIGGTDLVTTAGSDQVVSPGATFVSDGLSAGARFEILDDTTDGRRTRTLPYIYVRNVVGERTLLLEEGLGTGTPFKLSASLSGASYSVNRRRLTTVSDPTIEKVRVFAVDSTGARSELYSPDTLTPDYEFARDGYQDYIVINDGLQMGDSVVLMSYGLELQRCLQQVHVWPHRKTNLLRAIMPQPTAISKIRITPIIVRRTNIEIGDFAVVTSVVGGHLVRSLNSNVEFCQPSIQSTGRRLSVTVFGSNFDFSGLNQVIFVGNTLDGHGSEALDFSEEGTLTTKRFFRTLTDVIATFTPVDISRPAGAVEVREALSITRPDIPDGYSNADHAVVRLSVVTQAGTHGTAVAGSSTFTDGYARFGAADIGKIIAIDAYGIRATITDVALDPSGTVKDSSTITLSGTGIPWGDGYDSLSWQLLSLSHGDSGFANGLITLERYGMAGAPFYLNSCWYEVDFPSYAIIPWSQMPDTLYMGSDLEGAHQAGAVIDELRILGEISDDTGAGEAVSGSGRSITTDAQSLREYEPTTQTLALFHFNDCVKNKASFYSGFSGSYFQSSDSVNELFGQSGVFTGYQPLSMDNNGIFFNNAGTLEFWVSPVLDTYNDPEPRYYVDLSPEQRAEATVVSRLRVSLPVRARSVSRVSLQGSETDYFEGGRLLDDGSTIVLGRPLPDVHGTVTATYVPVTSQGDRFSILKDENGALVFIITASGRDFRITAPVFWKKNTWHRILVGWDLNNDDSQDRMILMVDGVETGTIRYGTGLRYGTGVVYGMPTVWGSAQVGTTASRSLVSDINMIDFFSRVNIGADFAGRFPAMARLDNMRFSNELRSIAYLGGSGPGRLIGQDLLYTSNTNTAQPVIEDGLTTLLLDFDTDQALVEHLISVHDGAAGIFDFFVNVIDSFHRIPGSDVEQLITDLINRLKPAHTRAFVDFGDEDC